MNIAALISGGVDSAVVVHLLCEQGYKPDLFYIKIGMDGDEDLTCTAEEDIDMTRQLPDITPVFLKKTGKYGWEPHKTPSRTKQISWHK